MIKRMIPASKVADALKRKKFEILAHRRNCSIWNAKTGRRSICHPCAEGAISNIIDPLMTELRLNENMPSGSGHPKKPMFGTNTEGYLCVWEGDKGPMHYFSDSEERTQSELNQAKMMAVLLQMAKKLKVKVVL